MNILRAVVLFVTLAACIVAMPQPASAGLIVLFTPTSSGSITYTVSTVNPPAQAGSQTYGYTLLIQTATTAGSVTLTAPTIVGTGGNSISPAAFSASCTSTSDPGAIFSSLGTVRLGASPVSCANISRNSINTVQFKVTLYLDVMASAAGAFSADTYTPGSLTVTANAP